jgi:hypothetical protein
MGRKVVWIEEENLLGWGCSECAWVYNLSGPPTGNSLDEMMQHYLQRRDKEFAAHVCAKNPRSRKRKD